MVKYSGILGNFEYDESLWEVKEISGREHLVWKDASDLCELPEGVTDCSYMFSATEFSENFKFGNFNTDKVRDMSYMFAYCTFPNRFSLPDTFSTESLEIADKMFFSSTFKGQFRFSPRFIVRPVVSKKLIFSQVKMPRNINLSWEDNKPKFIAFL